MIGQRLATKLAALALGAAAIAPGARGAVLEDVTPSNAAVYSETVTVAFSAGVISVDGAFGGTATGPALATAGTGLTLNGTVEGDGTGVTGFSFTIIDISNTQNPLFLASGDLEDFALEPGRLDILVTSGGGTAASGFGSPLLFTLADELIAPGIFETEQSNFAASATITSTEPAEAPAAVPLPHSVLLLAGSLGAVAALRGRRRQRG